MVGLIQVESQRLNQRQTTWETQGGSRLTKEREVFVPQDQTLETWIVRTDKKKRQDCSGLVYLIRVSSTQSCWSEGRGSPPPDLYDFLRGSNYINYGVHRWSHSIYLSTGDGGSFSPVSPTDDLITVSVPDRNPKIVDRDIYSTRITQMVNRPSLSLYIHPPPR